MSTDAERFLKQALALPESDRAELAALLFESLDGPQAGDELEEYWSREVARRKAEIESGTVKTIPWP